LEDNELGPEGGMAIAEALKVNETIEHIKWGSPPLETTPSHFDVMRFVTASVTIFRSFHAYLHSLGNNGLGSRAGLAIAEALKVNKTVTTIK
jgi:hypothetical protein